MIQLTLEQQRIIHHQGDHHLTVIAVAGAGKTTTMVHRIAYLIQTLNISPKGIRAVMFNKAAQEDFAYKLANLAQQEDNYLLNQVKVQTFHSLGASILHWAFEKEIIPYSYLVTAWEQQDLAREAIIQWQKNAKEFPDNIMDIEEILDIISGWKSLLTPPEEAQHKHQYMVEIYSYFEKLRIQARKITFDDQIYEAVRLLETYPFILEQLSNRLTHLIIDEFQDINYARQRLIQLIAGERAQITVVGDDDQCIYEWNGARSAYIKRVFQNTFTHYPHITYQLTHSFRFGPLIAQLAANVIAHNTDRIEKSLIAYTFEKEAFIEVGNDPEMDPIDHLQNLLASGVPPKDMVILVRSMFQSSHIQSRLIRYKIPFIVEGGKSFIEDSTVKLLINYLLLLEYWDEPLQRTSGECFKAIINRPFRFVKKEIFNRLVEEAIATKMSLKSFFEYKNRFAFAGLHEKVVKHIIKLGNILARAVRYQENIGVSAELITKDIDFLTYFASYRSQTRAEQGIAMQQEFVRLLKQMQISLVELHDFIHSFDTTLNCAPEQCIKITTIFKAKGLEWDYVFLPDLVEGAFPDMRAEESYPQNKLYTERNVDGTEIIESERRLFYVALTRACKGVYLYPAADENYPESRFIHETLYLITQDVINILYHIIKNQHFSEEQLYLIIKAATQKTLKDNLLQIISYLIESYPQAKFLLEKVMLEISQAPISPFKYPKAFKTSSHKRKTAAKNYNSTGLPF